MNYSEFALSLAEKAGKIILKNFNSLLEVKHKEDLTPVTKVDFEINSLLINSVKEYFPNHNVVAEEESFDCGGEYSWVCDPLDGTIPFSSGIPLATFALALTHKGKGVLAVVNDPFHRNIFFAEEGKGTFLNGKQVFVSEKDAFSYASIGACIWKRAKYDFSSVLKNLVTYDAGIFTIPSIAFMGSLVSSGSLDGVLFPGDAPWDIAAIDLLINEAGGKTSNLFGEKQDLDKTTKGFIGGNKKIYSKLLDIVKDSL
jgi:fructose-1,6-bisphosphatase/inositol monophosphatase family enzyme